MAESSMFRPPHEMKFDGSHGKNLSDTWRIWREEMELYLDVAMPDKVPFLLSKFSMYLRDSFHGCHQTSFHVLFCDTPLVHNSTQKVIEESETCQMEFQMWLNRRIPHPEVFASIHYLRQPC